MHWLGSCGALQYGQDRPGALRRGGAGKLDLAITGDPRRAEVNLVLVDRRAAAANLLDQRKQWTAKRHQFLQRLAPQKLSRNLEERFRGHIGVDDLPVRRDQQHRIRQGVENRFAVGWGRSAMFCNGGHAAALPAKSTNTV